jgi:quaternary ammonium compound-resistance protein SugE
MSWVLLSIAGVFEVVWAIALKYTQGFTKLGPSIITIIGMIVSFGFLSLALKNIPIGTAYAVWTGIGAVGTVIIGMLLFGEPATTIRLLFIGLIVSGIVGLKLTA